MTLFISVMQGFQPDLTGISMAPASCKVLKEKGNKIMFGLFGKRWEVADTSGKHGEVEKYFFRKNAAIYAREMNEWDEYFPGSVFVVRRINAT